MSILNNIYDNFITLEGGEGSGKTTIAKKLEAYYKSKGYEVLLTREPGGDKTAEKIRTIIMENEIHPKTEAHLFAAARIEHINNVILPALKDNKIVICDRYVDSSLVYQELVGKVENVKEINEYAYKNCMPKNTFFFNISPSEALKRLDDNNREKNRFDKQNLEYHQKIYEAYISLIAEEKRIINIDATKKPKDVAHQIITFLE